MKALLTTVAIAAAALLTGCGAAAQATVHSEPHKLQTPAPIVETVTDSPEEDEPGWDCTIHGNKTCGANPQEDEPGWDCWTMGTKTCGANPIERTEAWGSFQTSSVSADLLKEAFRATYYGIANQGVDFPPSDYVTIPSQITVGKVHVFLVEKIPA